MKTVPFEAANHVLRGKSNSDDDMPCNIYQPEPNALVTVTSCWELTDEEIEHLCKTRKLYLGIQAKKMPGIILTVFSPFDKPEEKS